MSFQKPTKEFLAEYVSESVTPIPKTEITIIIGLETVLRFEAHDGIRLDQLAPAMTKIAGYEIKKAEWSSKPYGQQVIIQTESEKIKFLSRETGKRTWKIEHSS